MSREKKIDTIKNASANEMVVIGFIVNSQWVDRIIEQCPQNNDA